MNRIWACIWLIGLLTTSSVAQTYKAPLRVASIPPLERQIDNTINVSSIDVMALMMKALSSTYVPGGLAVISDEEERSKYHFEPKSLALNDLLDSIIKTEPRYQWKIDKDVVNLFPVENHPLLNTIISDFQVEDASKEDMLDALEKTPAFQNALLALGIERFPILCCGGICTNNPAKYSVHLKNVTVQEILNEIVRLNGRSAWLYREWKSKESPKTGQRYYQIRFLVDFAADCTNIK